MKILQENSVAMFLVVIMCLLVTPMVLADMPQPVFDVYDYGAVGDGLTKNTTAFQNAINACFDAGGGTVWFHNGTFVTGQVELKGNITYYIDNDATILGSEDASDYPTLMPYKIPYCQRSMFYAYEADKITIDGKGIIDGRGWAEAWRPTNGVVHTPVDARPLILRFFRCDNLVVKNITLKDAAMWVQVYDQCNYVTIDNIKVDSVINHSDGLNITDSCHVTIKNCNIYSDDDAVVLKSFCGRGLDDIVIKNNILGTPRCMCFKIGTETCGPGLITNIKVIDNVAIRGTGGIEIASVDGANIDGVTVDNFEMRDIRIPILIRLGHRDRYKVGEIGSLKNITLKNIRAYDTQWSYGCVISGIPDHNIQNVTLEDMYMEMKGGLKVVPDAPPEKEKAYPSCPMFGDVPAYGFYVRHADNITFENVVIGYEQNDVRDWLVTEDATVNTVNCTNAGLLSGTIMINDKEDSVTYSGSWLEGRPEGEWPWAGPLYFPCYDRSQHFSDSNANSDSAEFTFDGISIKWIGTKAADKGKVNVYIDGVLDTVVDCYSPTPQFQAELYVKSELSNGPHTIKLQEANEKHLNSAGYNFTVDAFAYGRKFDDTSIENQMTEGTKQLSAGQTPLFDLIVSDVGRVSKKIGDIPQSFPRFVVPGFSSQMASVRQLFFLHYPGTTPKATMWDAWLPLAALWPAVQVEPGIDVMRQRWRQVLLDRHIGAEGYVSTHQIAGLAHGDGWPFPLWTQAKGIGWQFSMEGMPFGEKFGIRQITDIEDWGLNGIYSSGFDKDGLQLELTQAYASITTPSFIVDTGVAPFIRLEWQADGIGASANPYLEWTTVDEPKFSVQRRVYFSPISKSDGMVYTDIPTHKLPLWKGRITRLRFNFDNNPSAKVTIRSLITAVDSRHNINNFTYIRGCDTYINWTGDLSFLRKNINRMRLALRYAMNEFDTYEKCCVVTPWIGHDGRKGFAIDPNGNKTIYFGRGIGNNYWDLLPFGGKDCLATIYYFDVLNRFARLERKIIEHPEWNIPGGPLLFDPAELERHAKEVKDCAGKLFWNSDTGRFVSSVDIDGNSYDYGFTFVNCEAIYYGFATDEQARSILNWLSGKRIVEGDTSQGKDIYRWRFAPRATTKRNLEYYCWIWEHPEVIPWGGQVQDGGAVLGFSYHDLMARLKTNGPDDAWDRLSEIVDWFEDVKQGGGYRKYYAGGQRGSLQGSWTPGGLGLDAEFFESVLVPQVMLYGFMNFEPCLDGFVINPKLPKGWPQLTISRIKLHSLALDITASRDSIKVFVSGEQPEPLFVYAPRGNWLISYLDADGNIIGVAENVAINTCEEKLSLQRNKSRILQLKRM